MLSLSEAIRIGSRLSRQCRGNYDDGNGGTCALGSAGWAAGLSGSELNLWEMGKAFPILKKQVMCPVYERKQSLDVSIVVLNDLCHWTRDQIADWVESIEAQQINPASPVEVVSAK